MVGTTIVGLAKYASCCGLIFVDKRHITKTTKIYTPRKFLHVQYLVHSNFSWNSRPEINGIPNLKIKTQESCFNICNFCAKKKNLKRLGSFQEWIS